MKKLSLCKECEVTSECETLCLDAVVTEHEEPAEKIKGKYKANPQPMTSYKESRLHKTKHLWNRRGDDHA